MTGRSTSLSPDKACPHTRQEGLDFLEALPNMTGFVRYAVIRVVDDESGARLDDVVRLPAGWAILMDEEGTLGYARGD